METKKQTSTYVLKTLILGHSFVRHFKNFIKSRLSEYNFTLNLDPREVMIQYSGQSGATVDSLRARQLSDVKDFEPELVILDIGTNDLSLPTCNAEMLTSAIEKLIDTLLTDYNVQQVVVIQILHRFQSPRPSRRHINIEKFNSEVDICNQLLSEKLSQKHNCQFWWHKGFWGINQSSTIDSDGVHLSKPKGQRKYFFNLRAIVVTYLKSVRPKLYNDDCGTSCDRKRPRLK